VPKPSGFNEWLRQVCIDDGGGQEPDEIFVAGARRGYYARDTEVAELVAQLQAANESLAQAEKERDTERASHTKWIMKQAVHLFEIGLRGTDVLGTWRNARAEAAEAKLAPPSKPLLVEEELERIINSLGDETSNILWRSAWNAALRAVLSRLREVQSQGNPDVWPRCVCGGVAVSNASGDLTRTCIRCGKIVKRDSVQSQGNTDQGGRK
jgi:hypothetical protein